MKLKSKSILTHLFIYFLIFSAFIALFLYLVQIEFFYNFYKINQTNNLKETLEQVENDLNKKDFNNIIHEIALDKQVCIIVSKNDTITNKSGYARHCNEANEKNIKNAINDINDSKHKYIKKSIDLSKTNSSLQTDNNQKEKRKNNILIVGKKVNKDTYILVDTSLHPLNNSIMLLKKELKYTVVLLFLLSAIISYFYSKKIATPIIKISKQASEMGNKNAGIEFNNKTKIKEINELANQLNKVSKEIEKTESLRKEFMANISHDLKTPLTMIEAYASSAKDLNYNNKAKREKDLNIIIEEAERLNNLVNDILVLSRIESKTSKFYLEKINITSFIKSILERFEIYKNKGYVFIYNETKSHFIEADRQGLERILYNLIINAINYTGKDKTITITFTEKKEHLRVNITDTGKGIKKEDQKLVWNRYFRINKRHRREENGTGIGLAIVREILEANNIEYGIDSKINKGTTFWFDCKKK